MTRQRQQGGQGRGVRRVALAACWTALVLVLLALGTWQVYRLQWKLALIERVEQRVHAPAVPAPGPDRWPLITTESDEYRHVRAEGVFLMDLTTRVQAVTELGSGFWLLTPLRMADGNLVLVNRGFIPADAPPDAPPSAASSSLKPVSVTGLLRMSEPRGAFLRYNNPATGRWHSRDVQAIAGAHGLHPVAPYFIDADRRTDQPAGTGTFEHPVAGLTVIAFHNNHLVYALTWYALACMAGGAGVWVLRHERRRRGQRARDDGNEDDDNTGGTNR